MSDDPWSNLPRGGGDYFKFNDVGDSVAGTMTAKRAGTDFNGNPCPELDIETGDGETVTLSAAQAQLKRLLMDANPQVGDRLSIVYTHDEKTTKGSNMKCFDVAIKAGAGDGAATETVGAGAGKPSAADLL